MKNATVTTTTAQTHLNASVTFAGQSYTFDNACEHVAHLFDQRDDTAELVLFQTRDIGLFLLQLRGLYKSDKQFGQAVGRTALGKRSAQDRNDAMHIATHWDKVEKLNAKGDLNKLGGSAVRKRLKQAESAGNTSKGKPKAQAPAATPSKVTAESLATATLKLLLENGISVADFRKALTAATKAS